MLFAVACFTPVNANNAKSEKSELSLKSVSNAELGIEYSTSITSPVGISVTKVYEEGIAQIMGIKADDQIF
jgi:hypothetical protein